MNKIEKAPDFKGWSSLNNQEFPHEILTYLYHPECKKVFEKINEDYLYWDKVKYKKIPEVQDITPEKFWAALTFKREIGSIPVKFNKYSFQYLLTNHIAKSLHEFDMKFGGNINLDGTPEIDKRQYLISSIMEEAIASSQIEGAVTTRKRAKEMLRKNLAPKSTSDQMILNNYNTIRHISTIKNKKLTPELLLEIHRRITHSTLENPDDEGKFRNMDDINVVDITDNEIVYTPPSHAEIPELIKILCDYFNEDGEELYTHPIVKGCIVHFMIGWIHPFVDGNGRTARAMFYWYLLNKGYWLIEYMSISRLIIRSKAQYAMAYLYTETDRNDLTYFINYNIRTLHLAFNGLHLYLQKKIKERKQFKMIAQIGYINERQAEIIRLMNDDDATLSVRELEEMFGVSNQTIRNDLKGLMDRQIVREIPLDNKSNVYGKGEAFNEILRLAMQKK